ncbi:MAG: hypothetical protein N4A47_04685 [Clostridia bacterium]|nr:hypothetical protein [Clostridia bacterium]
MNNLNFIFDRNADFLHLIDNLSGWSKFVKINDKNQYLEVSSINQKDEKMLKIYAMAREKLKWPNEIALFKWASDGFTLDAFEKNIEKDIDKQSLYDDLKGVIDYFKVKDELVEFARKRYDGVLANKELVLEESKSIKIGLEKSMKIIEVFGENNINMSLPIYIFSGHGRSFGGGANGNGIYIKVDIEPASRDLIKARMVVAVHELIHKMLNVRNKVSSYRDIMSNDIKEKIDEALNEKMIKDKTELGIMEEIIVYTLAEVYQGKKDINKTIKRYEESQKRDDLIRIWRGIKILKPLFDRFMAGEITKEEFVKSFLSKYFEKVYKSK